MKKFLTSIFLIVSVFAGLLSKETDKIYVREGSGSYGTIVYTIDGKYVREGSGSYGKVKFTVEETKIREGSGSYGKVLYTIDGKHIREGSGSYGFSIHLQINKDNYHSSRNNNQKMAGTDWKSPLEALGTKPEPENDVLNIM